MKNIFFIAVCICTLTTSYAQTTAPAKVSGIAAKKAVATSKCVASGTIRDMHNFPLSNVKVFVYAADSSIIASGYTDEKGFFETNTVTPGTYNVKVAYQSQKAILITGVQLKAGVTPINIKANEPAEDTTIAYADIAPKPVGKKK